MRRGADLAIAATAVEKLGDVDRRILDLQRTRRRLQEVVARGCNSLTECSCGECPLDEDLGASAEVSGTGETVPVPVASPALETGMRRWIPAALLATAACLICLLPALSVGAGFVGVAAFGGTESLEVSLAGAVGAAAGIVGVTTLWPAFSRRCRANCGCVQP